MAQKYIKWQVLDCNPLEFVLNQLDYSRVVFYERQSTRLRSVWLVAHGKLGFLVYLLNPSLCFIVWRIKHGKKAKPYVILSIKPSYDLKTTENVENTRLQLELPSFSQMPVVLYFIKRLDFKQYIFFFI